MNRRTEQKVETRQRILQAAYCRFGRSGISATRMQDVADEAGVSHGSVFMHFKSQEALLCAVIEDFGRRVSARTHELAKGEGGVRGVLEAHLQALWECEDFYYRLISEYTQLPGSSRDQIIMIQSVVSLHLSKVAGLAMQKGAIREMPLHLLFNTWMGLLHYYLLNRDLFAPGESVIGRRSQELLDHFMDLIGKGS